MKKNYKFYLSIVLEAIVVLSSIIGVILSIQRENDQFMGGASTILYFTIQSNLWICFILFVLFSLKIIEKKTKKQLIKRWMYILKYVFTISITLTGVVFCFLLAPVVPEDYNPWHLASLLTHVIVPVCAIADIFIDEYKLKIKPKEEFFVLIPPFYYLIFSIIGFFANFDFGNGQNYPYFFLNFGCEAGLFGFVKEPLSIGCFYWIVLMLIIVLGTGYLYKFFINKKYNKTINE